MVSNSVLVTNKFSEVRSRAGALLGLDATKVLLTNPHIPIRFMGEKGAALARKQATVEVG